MTNEQVRKMTYWCPWWCRGGFLIRKKMGRILVKDGLYINENSLVVRERGPNYQYLTLCVMELVILETPLGWACSCVYVTMKLVISLYINGVYSNGVSEKPATLKKKKTKFSSYIRKFRWDRVQSHI